MINEGKDTIGNFLYPAIPANRLVTARWQTAARGLMEYSGVDMSQVDHYFLTTETLITYSVQEKSSKEHRASL